MSLENWPELSVGQHPSIDNLCRILPFLCRIQYKIVHLNNVPNLTRLRITWRRKCHATCLRRKHWTCMEKYNVVLHVNINLTMCTGPDSMSVISEVWISCEITERATGTPSAEWNASIPVAASCRHHRCSRSTKCWPSGPLGPIPVARSATAIGPIGPENDISRMERIGAV